MKRSKFSFIVTLFNEENTVEKFLDSLFNQTELPNEIVIVDGGSTDKTVQKIKNYKINPKTKKIPFKLIIKPGNRSVGRNEAIKKSTGDIILCSDAGNILDKNWVKNITKPFTDKTVDVVSGYYKGKAKTIFEKCIIPYALVMPDKVNSSKFLPATRSIAFKKSIWEKVGGFNEILSHNEDYAFAKELKRVNAKIAFTKDAIVYWLPRNKFKDAFKMFFRFAYGDAESSLWRPKVIFIFTRYFFAFYLLYLSMYYRNFYIVLGVLLLATVYIFWAVKKNYKYVNDLKAFYYLPALQFTADAAVLLGSIGGIGSNFLKFIKKNKLLSLVIIVFIFLVGIRLGFGTPDKTHPFLYHMDEWHQLMALKAIVKHGSTTIPGAAHIPFLYPVLSGIYLIPFVLFHIVNPFALQSPVENLEMQKRLFEILRSVNIWFGIGCIVLVAHIAKRYFKLHPFLTIFFFALSPIFLLLSGYFKYDIGLLFFVILALLTVLRWIENQTTKNYIFAWIATGLAFATKFSAAPLIPLLIFSYIWFTKRQKRNYKMLLYGLITFIITFLLIGIPSIFLGKADFRELLYSNLITGPQVTDNLLLPYHWSIYLLFIQFPLPFGHLAYILGVLSFLYLTFFLLIKSRWKSKKYSYLLFLVVAFSLFVISLIPLKIGAGSNRVLVILPFIAIFAGLFISKIYQISKGIYRLPIIIVISLIVIFQLAESAIWIYTNLRVDPQQTSSEWIQKNVKKGTRIGIEDIPIYQTLPNSVLKEFYDKQYNKQNSNRFRYETVNDKTKILPKTVIISYDELHKKFYKKTSKKLLIQRLEKEGYKKSAIFTPDLSYFRLIGNDLDYHISGLLVSPLTITVYEKRN